VFASQYTNRLADQTAFNSLPAAARSATEDSVAAAQQVIGILPPPQSHDVELAVNDAFLGALGIGSLVCALVALMAAGVVAVLLPSRQSADGPVVSNPQPTTLDVEQSDHPSEKPAPTN
jgi:hypothetical protein